MPTFDLTEETRKLRRKSAIYNQRLQGIGIVMTIALVFLGAGNLVTELQNNEPWWLRWAILGLIETVCVLVGVYFYHRMGHLINNGEVTYARVRSTHWLPKGIYRINLEYIVEDQLIEKAINGPKFLANGLECQSALLAVVDPGDPRHMVLLYEFAASKTERENIFFGRAGLTDV